MKRELALTRLILCLLVSCLLFVTTLHAQEPAASTETPGHPFSIKNTWIIGGAGPWDYLTMDTRAERLYIAHNHVVQVVDVTTGAVTGEIKGLTDAHSIALDDTGEFGYVSDGRGGKVIVFDRRTLQTVATIENVPSPRALVFEPQTRLLFAVRADLAAPPPPANIPRTTTHITPRPAPPAPPPKPNTGSSITVIDTQTKRVAGQILLPDALGFAQADGRGNLYVDAPDRNRILVIDAQAVAGLITKPPEGATTASESAPGPASGPAPGPEPGPAPGPAPSSSSSAAASAPAKESAVPVTIDWTERGRPVRSFALDGQCTPKSLAIDSAHSRLFAACDNLKLLVLNADNGNLLATLPIGYDVDAVGYDANHGLIYAANGGPEGSLTIIRQHVSDSYAVIQTLPTRQRARTLAVDQDTGKVYLVTDLLGMDLSKPGGIGTLQTTPLNGSFQVLVVGN
jgi:DNA-binding beta-propeller fold protein YncE